MPPSEVQLPAQRDAARVLLVQQGLLEALKDGDKRYREHALPAWRTGETTVAEVDGVTVGKVRRDHGSTTVSVDEAKLLPVVRKHWPSAVEAVQSEPRPDAVERVAGLLLALLDDLGSPMVEGQAGLIARALLLAASEQERVDGKRLAIWKEALKEGEAIWSETARDEGGEPVEFYEVPGITVTHGDDKLVATPDRKALRPIIDKIMRLPELREVES